MKVLHLPFSFPPDPPGGTELYVQDLCRNLRTWSVVSVVAAPGGTETYDYDGVRVRRFRSSPALDLALLYAGDPAAAAAIGRIIDEERPDIVHQHALTSAVSPLVRLECRRRGIPLVFTYHTPTVTCQRGTLLEDGERVCDGKMLVTRCTRCTLRASGVNAAIAWALSRLPASLGRAWGRTLVRGPVSTGVRLSSLIENRQRAVREFLREVDRVVVPSSWVAGVMEANGVDGDRLVTSAHGVQRQPGLSQASRVPGAPLRLIHLGRIDPTKGTQVVLRAIRALSETSLSLDVFGIAQNLEADAHGRDLQRLAEADRRVRFHAAVRHEEVASLIAQYDLLVVPSQWMETGPLVVLEAFAAGVPVLASDLGGLSEKIRHGVDGWLVSPFDSVRAWTESIRRLCADAALLAQLRRGIREPRSSLAVAEDMARLYAALPISRRQDFAAHSVA